MQQQGQQWLQWQGVRTDSATVHGDHSEKGGGNSIGNFIEGDGIEKGCGSESLKDLHETVSAGVCGNPSHESGPFISPRLVDRT